MAAIQDDGNVMPFGATDFSNNGGQLSIADVGDPVGCGGVTIRWTQRLDGSPSRWPGRVIVFTLVNGTMSGEKDEDIVILPYGIIRRETNKAFDDVGSGGG